MTVGEPHRPEPRPPGSQLDLSILLEEVVARVDYVVEKADRDPGVLGKGDIIDRTIGDKGRQVECTEVTDSNGRKSLLTPDRLTKVGGKL